jgi:hypothetical protein
MKELDERESMAWYTCTAKSHSMGGETMFSSLYGTLG